MTNDAVLPTLNGDYHHDCEALLSEVRQLRWELLMVSKLAAEEPLFSNPFSVIHAEHIRDRVLADPKRYLSCKNDALVRAGV